MSARKATTGAAVHTPSKLPAIGGNGRWRRLVLLVANGLTQAGAAVVAALIVERVFAQLGNRTAGLVELAVYGALLLVAGGAVAMLRGRERVDAEQLGQHYTHDLRIAMFDHLTASSPRTLQSHSRGGTMLRFVGDLNGLRRWISLGLSRLLVSGTMAVGALIALAILSVVLAVATAAVIVAGAAIVVLRGTALQEATRSARRKRVRLAANVNEKVTAVGVMQAFGAIEREQRKLARQSRKLRQAMVSRARESGRILALSEGTAAAATAAVVLTGLVSGASAPTVAAAMTITGLLVPQLRDLGRVQEYWSTWCVSRDAVLRFFARPTMAHPPAATPARAVSTTDRETADLPQARARGTITFDSVSVDQALQHVSATAQVGEHVAIVGPNGAGKSTLLALAAGLLQPDTGRVLLDGRNLAGRSPSDVRALLGISGPGFPLLRGTVEHNLRYRCPDADTDEIQRVLELTDLDELLVELPDGLRTRLSEDGGGLSAGQAQRLMIARAILGRPQVLLLDEAEANLDHAAARVVDRVLTSHQGTALIVTHAVDRLLHMDRVWHVDDGRIVEIGQPDHVLGAGGPTSRLFGRTPHALDA